MYTSRKFSKSEGQKSSNILEILGIINTLNYFHLYIQNNTFTLGTDCNK